MDVFREVSEILGIFEDTEEDLAIKLALELQNKDENNNECTWTFMIDSSEENTKTWYEYRKEIAEQLRDQGIIPEVDFLYLQKYDFNFFKLPSNNDEILT